LLDITASRVGEAAQVVPRLVVEVFLDLLPEQAGIVGSAPYQVDASVLPTHLLTSRADDFSSLTTAMNDCDINP